MIGLALVVSFGIDVANTRQEGSINLRNRITGIRVFERGLDPYRYKWHEGDPPEYCDILNNPNQSVSKTTVTPTQLVLHAPLAALPYRPVQFLWLVVQWACLLGTGWLWWRKCATTTARWLAALFVTGLSYTVEWRWHADRGQIYVVLGFLFAYWLTTTMDPKRGNGVAPGFLAGFLVALRPTFILLLPFVALHRRGQLPGAVAGLLLGIGLPLIHHPGAWSEYSSAMKTNSEQYRASYQPAPDPQKHPAEIEGIPDTTLCYWKHYSVGDFSVHSLLIKYKREPFPEPPVLMLFATPFALWLWFSRKQPPERLLPGLAAWFFLADLFLPAARYSYYDVLILNAVLSGIALTKKIPLAAWPCLLALPFGWYVLAFTPGRPTLINMPAFYFTVGAVLLLFSFMTPSLFSFTAPADRERAKNE